MFCGRLSRAKVSGGSSCSGWREKHLMAPLLLVPGAAAGACLSPWSPSARNSHFLTLASEMSSRASSAEGLPSPSFNTLNILLRLSIRLQSCYCIFSLLVSLSLSHSVTGDFTLDFYFRQHWTDPRLSFPDRGGLDELTVGSEYLKKIWVPDTFFANEKKSYFHTATTSNEMLRITNQGKVLRSIR
ncbi:Gamma-aminobutyric acid receptor subunit beta [Portunus trituberculatus]|uniref:Gamma-aminobutyric acid receptor subunit beta n=1 Tax=Portunus trituberculatus TaxID=210409 RepID=A0A5B7HMS7_PORTR|nr:Gamma-aminobutyric acid receptor subunit beta [Portunus trituberculatus]